MNYESLVAADDLLTKTPGDDPGAEVEPALALIEAISGPVPRGADILDLGCGVGAGVASLVAMGFNARGVDILEYWGEHGDLFWLESRPPLDVTDRLSVATLKPYRLPYPDDSFDCLISMQVLEHVDDRRAVFAEIERVLKPGGVSVHLYPDPWLPIMEGHINVPVSPFCKSNAWLYLAARLGFRSSRQKGLGWQEVYRSNVAQMEMTHYAPRRKIAADARSAGLLAWYGGKEYVARSGTRWTRLHGLIGPLAFIAGRLILQPMLVAKKPALLPLGH